MIYKHLNTILSLLWIDWTSLFAQQHFLWGQDQGHLRYIVNVYHWIVYHWENLVQKISMCECYRLWRKNKKHCSDNIYLGKNWCKFRRRQGRTLELLRQWYRPGCLFLKSVLGLISHLGMINWPMWEQYIILRYKYYT